MTGILESTGGMSVIETAAVTWRRDDGEEPARRGDGLRADGGQRQGVPGRTSSPTSRRSTWPRQVPGQFKITMMSAAMGGMVWRPDVSAAAYPTPAELVQDLVALQIEEIGDLVDARHPPGPARLAVLQPGLRRRVPRRDRQRGGRPAAHPGGLGGRRRGRSSARVKAKHPDGHRRACTSAAATTAAPTWPRAATSRWPSACSARCPWTGSCWSTTPNGRAASSRSASSAPAPTVVLGLISSKLPGPGVPGRPAPPHRRGGPVRAR